MKKYLVLFVILAAAISAQNKVIEKDGKLYLAGKMIVKFKDTGSTGLYKKGNVPQTTIDELSEFGVNEIKTAVTPERTDSKYYDDLKRTYVLTYDSPYTPEAVTKKLSKLKDVEWVEPYYIYKTTLEPNDPRYQDGTQWYLDSISVSKAWDITTGSEDIIIAIIDTGVDWDHPDLAANIWNNEDEIAGNGIDDDNNGYIDDIRGWDFGGTDGTPDNNPEEDDPTHGTEVAGFASAVTNNGIGIAGIGYRCKLMAVKVSQANLGRTNIVYGPEGIAYAAEKGAKVINCSWGGAPYSNYLQSVINYATSLGALVISSADNDNSNEPTYPSSYYNVLSVGGIDSNNVKYNASNYGATVDLVAPATGGMYTTQQNDTYITGKSGTSYSSPIVAGIAGLVFSEFDNYTPQQIAEQIRVNTDDIYDVSDNSGYKYQLGSGKANAYKAVSNHNSISIRAEDFVYTDLSNGNGALEADEDFSIGVKFINYLNPASSIIVTLESLSSYVTVNKSSFTISSAATLDTVDNYNDPFTLSIAGNVPVNEYVELLLKFSGSNYDDFQLIRIRLNNEYQTQDINNIALTITSNGMLGYNYYDDPPSEGDGLVYQNGDNLLYESGFLYGTGSSSIMDCVHRVYLESREVPDEGSEYNEPNDFEKRLPFGLLTPGTIADQQGRTVFSDENDSSPLGIETHLNTFSFTEDGYEDLIILKYVMYNTTSVTVNNLYAGVFFDLDMNDYANDSVGYDNTGQFAYIMDNDSDESEKINEIIGTALISDTQYGYQPLNNRDSSFNDDTQRDTNPVFTDEDKWLSLSGGVADYGYTGDVAVIASGGPYSIEPGGYINIAFAVAGGYTIDSLRTSIQNARLKYAGIPTDVEDNNEELSYNFSLSQNYPNPFNPSTTVKFSVPTGSAVQTTLVVYNILGQKVASLINKKMSPGEYSITFDSSKYGLSSGVYFYRLTAGSHVTTKKMILLK